MFEIVSPAKKVIAVLLFIAAMTVSTFAFTHRAEAQSNREQMMAQIQQLLQIVLQLQAQLATMNDSESASPTLPEGGFTDRNVTVSDRVQTTDILRVRAAASANANWINNVPAYSEGTVVNGPRYADGYTWWHVNYDNGTSGWSAGSWLKKVSQETQSLPGVEMSVSPYHESNNEFVAEFDFGNWTSYTYEIDWGEGDNSTQTVNSRVITVCNSEWTCSGPTDQLHQYSKPGSYTVQLFALMPNRNGGTTRTLVESESVRIPEARSIISNESDASCRITTDQTGYVIGEEIEIAWTTTNAEEVQFIPEEENDSLDISDRSRSTSGSMDVEADVIGNPKIVMEVTDADGNTSTCSRTVNIKRPEVELRVNGSDVRSYTAEPDEIVRYTYHPHGQIETCEVTGYFADGSYSIEHDWDSWVEPGQTDDYGRGGFLAVSTYRQELFGELEEIGVRCEVSDYSDATDSMQVSVADSGERKSYQITYNGEEISTGSNATETEVIAACRLEITNIQYNGYQGDYPVSGDTVSCYWGGDLILEVDGWKG